MTEIAQALATVRDYVERTHHWDEGGATRHDALKVALPLLEKFFSEGDEPARPIGSIHRSHLSRQDGPWCHKVLLYSPDNNTDSPEHRVMLYTAGRLGDALEWANKGMHEWRALAQEKSAHLAVSQATARIAIGHLQSVVRTGPVPVEDFNARSRAIDWLMSIGSEPT